MIGRGQVGVVLAGVAVMSVAVSCGGPVLRDRLGAVDEIITVARDSGAVRCAPVELAMAESHADFARQELSEGRYYQARDELSVAEINASAALRKSPRELCAPPPSATDRDGDGIFDDVDQCPDEPEDFDGFQDDDGCPDPDNDGDGIPDVDDQCPDEPEDFDGFQDADGCPDPDNDGDGIPDVDDQCPDEPEDFDGFQDADGCPDPDNDGDGIPDVDDSCPDQYAETPDGCPPYKLIVVTQQNIQIKQTIFFEYNKATIKRVSYQLLDEVAEVLAGNPSLRVRIEGHTDDRGGEEFNLRLSQTRADAVLRYLVDRGGIAEARLEAVGYGMSAPLGDNRTAAGRAKNRRVEFVITSR